MLHWALTFLIVALIAGLLALERWKAWRCGSPKSCSWYSLSCF